MKKLYILIFLITTSVSARGLGIGIIIGSPTGLSSRYFFSPHSAIEINAGWSFWHRIGLHITGDYQFIFPQTFVTEEGKRVEGFDLYAGIGTRFIVIETIDGDADFHIGLRMGGGLDYQFSRFDTFLELYPVVDLIPGTDFDFEGGLGLRFYF